MAQRIFRKGELVYNSPTVPEIAAYCREAVDTLWDEVKRFEKPHGYYVDLSPELWELRKNLLDKYSYRGSPAVK